MFTYWTHCWVPMLSKSHKHAGSGFRWAKQMLDWLKVSGMLMQLYIWLTWYPDWSTLPILHQPVHIDRWRCTFWSVHFATRKPKHHNGGDNSWQWTDYIRSGYSAPCSQEQHKNIPGFFYSLSTLDELYIPYDLSDHLTPSRWHRAALKD